MRILCVTVLIIFLAGCTPEQQPAGTPVTVFTPGGADGRSALAERVLTLPEGEVSWRFALDEVLSNPPFPAGVRAAETALSDRALKVVLSEEASALGGFSLTLAKACIVLTLTGLDAGIDSVSLSVYGQTGEPDVLRAADFVLGALVLADTERRITLFFPDETGRVTSESHTLVVRETDTVDWYLSYMLEIMMNGPRTEGLLPVLPEGTRLLSVFVEGSLCTVNFSGEFVLNAGNSRVSHEMALHCLVRSISAQPGVSAVRLLIEGQPLERYGETDTSGPLTVGDVRVGD
jgi:spore germination protein GerM